ncbi:MAG: hypothetical protein SOZ45_04980 [Ruminococcus sp.]|nr:hypothetical protein [Ruminococcus sp.]
MKNKRDTINLIFSAFLVIAYIICSYFFTSFASTMAFPVKEILTAVVFAVFGLLMFYATRVGEGKAVRRFSLATLLILDLPALYIIVAAVAPGLPLHDVLNASLNPAVMTIASFALGYGIPYTFVSGFELVTEEIITDMPAVEGGVAQDVEESAPEAETTYTPSNEEDEIVVEGTNPLAEDALEDTTEDTPENDT